MGISVRALTAGVGCLLGGAAGCQAPPQPPRPPVALPAPTPPLTLASGSAYPLEPDPAAQPGIDPTKIDPASVAPEVGVYLPLTEAQCLAEAQRRPGLAAALIDPPGIPGATGKGDCAGGEPSLRDYLRAEAQSRAAAAALDSFYQLADATGRERVVRTSLPVLDDLRRRVTDAQDKGVKTGTSPDELDRQRATLLSSLNQAELGAGLLDLDLKRRLGVVATTPGRIEPTGPFPAVPAEAAEAEPLIPGALELRPDLRLLRAAYHRLDAGALPFVRRLLEAEKPDKSGGQESASAKLLRRMRPSISRRDRAELELDAADEVALRKAQLYEVILLRERQAADEVRAAVLSVNAQARQVALAAWRVRQSRAKLEAGPDPGPLERLAGQLELARNRAELVAAVMGWQQQRVKLLAAQGLLAPPLGR